ncbi:MAG: GT4 family glycosyltransferase PelF [Comamonadaceae bacterium]|nr:GT4 family glycosyltransferase PelF [Comamonadaceae bacterium]
MSRLALASIAFEALACALLAAALGPAPEWFGLAAVLHAAAPPRQAPGCSRRPHRAGRGPGAVALALGLIIAVPALGLAGVLALRQRLARAVEQASIEASPAPEFAVAAEPLSESEERGPRGTAVRALLRDRAASTEARSRALLALDRAPVQAAAPLLREALSDPGEELRILACLMLERRESLLPRHPDTGGRRTRGRACALRPERPADRAAQHRSATLGAGLPRPGAGRLGRARAARGARSRPRRASPTTIRMAACGCCWRASTCAAATSKPQRPPCAPLKKAGLGAGQRAALLGRAALPAVAPDRGRGGAARARSRPGGGTAGRRPAFLERLEVISPDTLRIRRSVPPLDVLLLAQDDPAAILALVRSLPELRFGLIWLDDGSAPSQDPFERLVSAAPRTPAAPRVARPAQRAARRARCSATRGRRGACLRATRTAARPLARSGGDTRGAGPSGPPAAGLAARRAVGPVRQSVQRARLGTAHRAPAPPARGRALSGAVQRSARHPRDAARAARGRARRPRPPACCTLWDWVPRDCWASLRRSCVTGPCSCPDADPQSLQARLRAWIAPGEAAAARDLRQRYEEALDRLALACADCVVTPFEFQRQRRIADGADPRRTVCIAPGAAAPPAQARLDPTTGRAPARIGVAGPITPLQDIRTLLRALHIVLPYLPGIEAWIVGECGDDPGYAQDCRALAQALGLERHLHFAPEAAPGLDSLGLMVSSAIAAGPTRSLIDALAAGLPCVCTDAGAARQLVYGLEPADIAVGSAGEVVAVADAQALAAAIVRLLGDGDAWAEASRAAIERSASFYAPQQAADQWRSLYAEALAGSLIVEDALEDPA